MIKTIQFTLNDKPVRVITPFVGGGFGGKSASSQAVEAARLAKRSAKPVMVIWTREEEFFFDTFRPAAVVKIRSGIDGAGRMSFWDYRVYFAGERGCRNFYEIPQIETVIVPNPILEPKGGGEPAIVCMGGVLATAVYDATGAKVLQLPMTPQRVKRALKEVK
jgi:CO/xanthine dehydrogenase Mo-binding subunit